MCHCCATLDGLLSTNRYCFFKLTSKQYSNSCAYWLPQKQVKLAFFVRLVIISSYSARLQLVTQALQGVQLDTFKVCRPKRTQDLLLMFHCHRQNAEERFKELFSKAEKLAESSSFDRHLPRKCLRQDFRANGYTSTVEEYFFNAIFMPCQDSIIASLEIRFSAERKQSFSLFSLYPKHMTQMSEQEYMKYVEDVETLSFKNWTTTGSTSYMRASCRGLLRTSVS